MKTIFVLSILFSAIALPALGQLTDADLDKIRLIVKEEVKKESTVTNTKIDRLDTRMRTIETGVAWTRGRLHTLDRYIAWLMVLIVVAIGIPQLIVAWRSRKDRMLEKQIEVLTQEIETLKQRQIVNP